MEFTLVLSLAIVWGACNGQNDTVRYEPLKNKDIDAEDLAWENGSGYYVQFYGLSSEWLETITDDNVTLRIQHIWNPRVKGTRVPVLLLPAIGATGDLFLINRPESNFVMTLANEGYDVFLASQRGSMYSPISPEKEVDTTLDGYALLDVPPIFDKVLSFTNQPNLHLVGYSRGTTVALAFLANRTEYNDKVRLLLLMGPVTYFEKPQALVASLMFLLKVVSFIGGDTFARVFDTNFFFDFIHTAPTPELAQFLLKTVPIIPTCVLNLFLTGRLDCFSKINIDPDIVKKVLTRGWPHNIYSRELIQYSQDTMAEAFETYSPSWLDRDFLPTLLNDYSGTEKYNLANVKCPVAMLEASIELFSQPEDYKRIRNQLCSRIIEGKFYPKKYVLQVKTPNYNHADIVIARNNDQIYAKALYRIMREFDISLDESLQGVLGFIDADFSNLAPQACEAEDGLA